MIHGVCRCQELIDKLPPSKHYVSPLPYTLFLLGSFSLFLLFATTIQSAPTLPSQAKNAVQNWLAIEHSPLGSMIENTVDRVSTYYDDKGEPLYHIVFLVHTGLVIVAGDDLVEPIVGFLPGATSYNPSGSNPLGALVTQDVPGRVKKVREVLRQSRYPVTSPVEPSQVLHQRKWQMLTSDNTTNLDYGLSSLTDVRVSPLVQSKWGQTQSDGNLCYNLYTPNNWPSGCVATAFAQIMRFFEFPTTDIGTASYPITVGGESQNRNLLGGDGLGSPYDWGIMSYGPNISSLESRRSIGRLMNDTGVSVNMIYGSSGSGANTLDIANALKNTFGYSNAMKGSNSGNNIGSATLNSMVNPNLDAGFPVALGIDGSGGHAIVSDGYGYQGNTLYHHLNMGWSGSQDAWYNLPNVDDAIFGFDSVYKCVYNIYSTGSGEIISGRVLDEYGNPVSGATVIATLSGGGEYSDTTDSKGIYALVKVPSNSTFDISAFKSGYGFLEKTVSTLTSSDYSTVGNKWGINFTETSVVTPPPTPGVPIASDGLYREKVTVSWSNVFSADSYDIYRCSSTSEMDCLLAGNSLSSPFEDTDCAPGTVYYYRITAKNSNGTSAMSPYNTGFSLVRRDFPWSLFYPAIFSRN